MEGHLDRVIPNKEGIRWICTINIKDQVNNKEERDVILLNNAKFQKMNNT